MTISHPLFVSFGGEVVGECKPAWVAWAIMNKSKRMGGMGFRDMELFNLALLARQAWRLLNDTDSLSARLLKAVYFPEVSLLQAELGTHPSQIWRAILDGRDVMAQGVVRRIGDGVSTGTWDHNWIPRASYKRSVAARVAAPPCLVSELIEPSTASWKEELIRAVFTEFDAEAIMQIPLCTRRVEDFWSWGEEPRGNFSVGSAYRMLVRTKHDREGWLDEAETTSTSEGQSKEWKAIWKVAVPSEIKVFLWRLARNSIPSGDVLHRRNMSTTRVCGLCGTTDSWRHALLNCPMARCTWVLSSEEILDQLSSHHQECPKLWLFALMRALKTDEFIRFSVSLWAIWGARRKALYEGIFKSPQATPGFINSFSHHEEG